MKYLISILVIFNISCINKNKNVQISEIQLDDLRTKTNHATILFHHQIQKKSIIENVYHEKNEIDSLFSILGAVNNDTTCNKGGLFNHFGEIELLMLIRIMA